MKYRNGVDGIKHYKALDERYGIIPYWDNHIPEFFKEALKLENYARSVGYRECCEAGFDYHTHQEKCQKILDKFIDDYFIDSAKAHKEFVLNWDPRGYAVKMEADDIRKTNIFTDFGGYGILIPNDIYFGSGRLHKTKESSMGQMYW